MSDSTGSVPQQSQDPSSANIPHTELPAKDYQLLHDQIQGQIGRARALHQPLHNNIQAGFKLKRLTGAIDACEDALSHMDWIPEVMQFASDLEEVTALLQAIDVDVKKLLPPHVASHAETPVEEPLDLVVASDAEIPVEESLDLSGSENHTTFLHQSEDDRRCTE
jgi:hypothetical protein